MPATLVPYSVGTAKHLHRIVFYRLANWPCSFIALPFLPFLLPGSFPIAIEISSSRFFTALSPFFYKQKTPFSAIAGKGAFHPLYISLGFSIFSSALFISKAGVLAFSSVLYPSMTAFTFSSFSHCANSSAYDASSVFSPVLPKYNTDLPSPPGVGLILPVPETVLHTAPSFHG